MLWRDITDATPDESPRAALLSVIDRAEHLSHADLIAELLAVADRMPSN
jgi:hypothetical protein